MDDLTPEQIEHDARMMFDDFMRELDRLNLTNQQALALVRKIARDGNGW